VCVCVCVRACKHSVPDGTAFHHATFWCAKGDRPEETEGELEAGQKGRSGAERELRSESERATVREGRARGKEGRTVHSRRLQGPRRGLNERGRGGRSSGREGGFMQIRGSVWKRTLKSDL
jgi:hypothetical protein